MSVLANKQAIVVYSQPEEDLSWYRPEDWLTLPTVTSSEQKFVGLHAVFPTGSNFCVFQFTTDTGSFQVDWGDGNTELFSSSVTASHSYDYTAISSSTYSSQGYRQVIVTVTPETGSFTSCDFNQRYAGETQGYATGWLDISLSMPSASAGRSIVISGNNVIGSTFQVVVHRNLEQFTLLNPGGMTNCSSMFRNCNSLQSVPLFDTSAVTNMESMFNNCSGLKTIPLFNTSAVTDTSNMFNTCYSLKKVPLLDTSALISGSGMFSTCRSLPELPLLDLSSLVLMQNFVANCNALKAVPPFNTSNVTTMFQAFVNLNTIETFPLLDTSKVTDMTNLLSSCTNLREVPPLDTSACTNTSFMLNNCNRIQEIPFFDTSNVTNMTSMFTGCASLKNIPALSTAAITTSSGTDFGSFANNCASLNKCSMIFARTVSFNNSSLGRDALVEIFTNLVDRTSTTSATITISNNPGASLLSAGDRAIATGKNWAITG